MSWSVKEVVVWLNEVEPIADQRGKFDWLEIPPTASSTAIQEAYHHVARTRHPDLFRTLDPKTLDRLVRMYGRITSAYADLKDPEKCAAYLRELRGPKPQSIPPPPRTGVPVALPTRPAPISTPPPVGSSPSIDPASSSPGATPPKPGQVTQPIPRVQRDGPIDPASAMNPRALAFYRRAEGAQRTGDKAAALLQIKMAIAADPKSTFLRAALAELTKS